jgi:hypothetical protein
MSEKRSGLLAPAILHFMFSTLFGLFHQAVLVGPQRQQMIAALAAVGCIPSSV